MNFLSRHLLVCLIVEGIEELSYRDGSTANLTTNWTSLDHLEVELGLFDHLEG